ncbi:hypothetical protein AAHA92_24194 [Salvia divinorum]|uniref:S-protein homolog n=1 Tax=Salvia divinorum TaxID=28513 RepID=A0ABD1G7C8_SALDI
MTFLQTLSAPNSSLPLRVHCASGDDDIGFHTLYTHNDLHWSFCTNFGDTTLFFCHLWWGNTVEKAFDVFSSSIDKFCDGTCNWVARHDGIYFSGNRDPMVGLIRKHYWEATQ